MESSLRDRARGAKYWVGIVALVLAAILIFQNAQKVNVDFFFWESQTPLIFALLLAFVLGVVVGLVLPRFRQPKPSRDD